MANDFKRMWTEEEIGGNQFLQRRLDKPSKVITIPANENGWDVVDKFTGVGYTKQFVEVIMDNEDEDIFNCIGVLQAAGTYDGIYIDVVNLTLSGSITTNKILVGTLSFDDYNGIVAYGLNSNFEYATEEIKLSKQASYNLTIKFY